MTGRESAGEIEMWQPSFLENLEEEFSNHKVQAAKNLKHLKMQHSVFFSYCEALLSLDKDIHGHSSEFTQQNSLLNKLKRESDTDESKKLKLEHLLKSLEADVTGLRGENEKIQDEIFQLSEDCENLLIEKEHLDKKKKEATEKIQGTWKAYILAKQQYKKYLDCHIRLHDSIETSQENEDSGKKLSQTLTFSYTDGKETVLETKLNRSADLWEMLETNPFIPAADEAQVALHKTNDIREFLCRLREEAVKLSKQ